MQQSPQKQSGFALVEIVIVVLVLGLIIGAGAFVASKQKRGDTTAKTTKTSQTNTASSQPTIKHVGVNLDTYDPATNKAGDFVFTKDKFAAGDTMQMIFHEYGMTVPGNSASAGREKANPQPTFIVPLGTKVHALVDGTVFDVPKLYSGDYSVRVQSKGSDLIFETEHVINVKVKQGDKVKAGDVVAEVSDYTTKGYAGLGLVEIGVLQGGNPPKHLCPFDYLDPSIKASTLAKITALKQAWETYRGDSTIYDESKAVIPGCLTREPIEG